MTKGDGVGAGFAGERFSKEAETCTRGCDHDSIPRNTALYHRATLNLAGCYNTHSIASRTQTLLLVVSKIVLSVMWESPASASET